MSSLGNISTVLASAVADDGTVAVSYPTGTNQAGLTGSTGGEVTINDGAGGRWDQGDSGATFSFGASTITITNKSGVSWPVGATLRASFGSAPSNGSYNNTDWANIANKPATFPPVIGEGATDAAAGDGSNPNYAQPA